MSIGTHTEGCILLSMQDVGDKDWKSMCMSIPLVTRNRKHAPNQTEGKKEKCVCLCVT